MESEDTENEVIEIVPMDEYQFNRAKLKSSLAWILQKAFGENVPNEFKEPFYEKSDGNFQVKPHLINSLVSSDVYCQACARMFSETSQQWQGHCSIIQVLSRKGIYVMEKDESAVTETILMQTAPFRVNAHIALIDALMLAYASEVVSVERAVQAVRRITTFNASSELPSGTEDSVIFWLNKVCTTAIEKEKKSEQTGTSSPSDSVTVPVMTDILKDIGDGCTVAVVCSFYCPQSLNFHDICLKDGLGIANSLYNLRLIKTFCERHLPINFFHFTYEDLLYSRDSIRENLLAFLAELFFWFEMIKLTETGQLLNGQETETSHYGNGRSSVTKHQVPISNATKRSFHKTESRFTSTPELNKSNSTLLKQEGAEQKTAEERARRKQIYEQYLQKKRQKEAMENRGERPIEPNRASDCTAKTKPRPKSMFVKATPSDQEDTSSVGSHDEITSLWFLPSFSLSYWFTSRQYEKSRLVPVRKKNSKNGWK